MNIERKRMSITPLLGATALLLTALSGRAESTNWGPTVSGVQLSIGTTNQLANIGSNWTVFGRIRNSSTNTVAIGFAFDPVYDFNIKLIDEAGREHDAIAKQPVRTVNGNHFFNIEPGNSFEMAVPIHGLNSKLKPGHYKLKAKRLAFLVRADGTTDTSQRYELTSNFEPVEVR